MKYLKVLGVVVAVVVFMLATGMVGIHYVRPIHNDPLLAPVKVAKVERNILVLEDGRRLKMESTAYRFDSEEQRLGPTVTEMVGRSRFRIDFNRYRETQYFDVHVSWRDDIIPASFGAIPLAVIPIIPVDTPNRRQALGMARLIDDAVQPSQLTSE